MRDSCNRSPWLDLIPFIKRSSARWPAETAALEDAILHTQIQVAVETRQYLSALRDQDS